MDDMLHLVEVHDGEAMNVIGHQMTFFDIQSTKAKQYGFCMDLGNGRKLTCCGDEPYDACEEKYARDSEWLLHEAFCLYSERDILIEQGVPEDRLILEDQAKSTKENFRNIAGIISVKEPVVMISSNYHMDRAARTASKIGFSHVMRLPAPSGFGAFGSNMLMEVLADLGDLIG